jgi:hypothetical protein
MNKLSTKTLQISCGKIIFVQACKFQVGSYSYDLTKMSFTQTNKVQG